MAAEDLERTIEELNAAMQELVRVISPAAAAELERTKAARDAIADVKRANAREAEIRRQAAEAAAAAEARREAKRDREEERRAAKREREAEKEEARREQEAERERAALDKRIREIEAADKERIEQEKAKAQKVKETTLKAAEHLVGAFSESSKAVYQGKLGAESSSAALTEFGKTVELASVALALLVPGGPLIKALAVAAGFIAGKLVDTLKAATDQLGKVYTAFQGVAEAGGNAVGGIDGVFNSLQKFGLGVEQAEVMLRMLGENSGQLSSFGGTVAEGQKALEDTVKGLRGFRTDLGLMGIDRAKLVEVGAQYMRIQQLQTRQTKDQIDLSSEAVMKYVKETDLLTRITGASRKKQEEIMDEAMSEEIFASKIDEMMAAGGEQAERAKRMQETNLLMATKYGKDGARAYRDSVSGFVGASDASKKFFNQFQGEGQDFIDKLTNTTMTQEQMAEGFAKMAQRGNEVTETFRPLTQMGRTEDFLLPYREARKGAQIVAQDIPAMLKKAEAERLKQLSDPKARQMQENINRDQDTQLKQQQALNLANQQALNVMELTSKANETLADAALAAAEALYGVARKPMPSTQTTQAREAADQKTTAAQAAGDKVKELEKSGAPKEQIDKAKAERRTAEADVAQSSRELLQAAKKDENDRKEARKRANIEQTMGKKGLEEYDARVAKRKAEEAEAAKKSATAAPAASKAVPAATPSGAASKAVPAATPSGAGAVPEPKAATPARPKSQPPEGSQERVSEPVKSSMADLDKIMKFTERSGSKQAFEGLDSNFKNAVIAAATEFNTQTGGQFQINSAKRNSEDQQRVWDESVAAGRPGISPTGMKIAKPGSSLHESGQAIDIQNYQDPVAVAALNKQGLYQKVAGDPVHFQARDGGVFSGPTSGYPATLHGTEAVVPLKNGDIPVKLNSEGISESLQEIVDDFKSALTNIVSNLVGPDPDLTRETLEVLRNIERAARASTDVQDKMLRAAQN